MTPESVMSIGQQALQVMILVLAPVLLAGLAVGLFVSVFQAATQINEATLSFIPKLLAMLGAMVIAGPWMLQVLLDYMRLLLEGLPFMIG
jgi:flagellar biosynthesis protein FliQ